MEIFISYAHRDGADLAKRLAADLERAGHKVWFDRDRLRAGNPLSDIERAIDRSEVMLALLSAASSESPLCRGEQHRAREKGVRVIPVHVQSVVNTPITLGDLTYRDFSDLGHYERNLEQLLTDMTGGAPHAARTARVHTPVTAPPLLAPFVERPQAYAQVVRSVLAEDADATALLTAVSGLAGVGKTSLALRLCHDESIQGAFRDGICWTELGPKALDVREQLREVGRALGDRETDEYTTERAGAARLRTIVAEKAVLLVVDNVWSVRQLDLFRVLGPSARTVFTTRNKGIAFDRGARLVDLDVFTRDESLALLRKAVGRDDPALNAIAERLGDHPQAIAIAAAQLRAGTPPRVWLNEFRMLSDLNTYSGGPDLKACFGYSMRQLMPPQDKQYLALGIFPPSTRIPIPVAAGLFRKIRAENNHRAGIRIYKLLDMLENYCLIHLRVADSSGRHGSIALHSLLRDYLRETMGQEIGWNQDRFLGLYRTSETSWSGVADDGYLHSHLAYHLHDAGRDHELRTLLLDIEWQRLRLNGAGISGLLSDFEFLPNDIAVRLVHGALRLAEEALATDPAQLPAQLLGRLERGSGPEIDALLDAARKDKGLWLRPLVPTLTLRQSLRGHAEGVSAVGIGGDGDFLVSGSDDGTLKVWRLPAGREHRTLGHGSAVKAVAVSNTHTVSGADDGSLKVWNLGTGEPAAELAATDVGVKAAAFTPDGATVLGGYDDGVIRIWNWRTNVVDTIAAHEAPIRALSVSGDGVFAASGSEDGDAKVWQLKELREKLDVKLHSAAVSDLVFRSPNEVVSSSWDGTIKVWDRTNGDTRLTLTGHTNAVTSLAMSRDGKRLISGSADDTIKVWDVATGVAVSPHLIGHTAWVRDVALIEPGIVISGSDDGTIGVWDIEYSSGPERRSAHSDAITALAFVQTGGHVVSASADMTLKVWEIDTGLPRATFHGHEARINAVVACPDGRTISGSDDHTIRIWDDAGQNCQILRGHTGAVKALALANDAELIVSGSADHMVFTWDLNGTLRKRLPLHSSRVRAVACSSDGRFVVSAYADGALVVWEIGSESWTILQRAVPAVKALAILPGRAVALAGSDDGALSLWDLENRRMLCSWTAHRERVDSVAAADKVFVSASCDKTLALWESDTDYSVAPRRVAGFTADCGLYACAVDQAGCLVAGGDASGATHFLAVNR